MELHKWQKDMIEGIRKGEMTVMMSGRQTGKSTYAQYAKMFNEIFAEQPVSDIVLSEGTVYGKRYYCAEPKGGNWTKMEAWVTETMGKHGGAIWGYDPKKSTLPNERWYMNNSKFWFRTEQDRTMFLMKWR